MLFSVSQGFSVPCQFIFQERAELHAVLRTEVIGCVRHAVTLFGSATLYVLDCPYCGY